MTDKTCIEPDCTRPQWGRGLCRRHHYLRSKAGTLPPKLRTVRPTHCTTPGCGDLHLARGLCNRHYSQMRATGRLARQALTADELVAEVEWLAGTDSRESIAERLGFSTWKSLERRLYNLERRDLARRIRGYMEVAA